MVGAYMSPGVILHPTLPHTNTHSLRLLLHTLLASRAVDRVTRVYLSLDQGSMFTGFNHKSEFHLFFYLLEVLIIFIISKHFEDVFINCICIHTFLQLRCQNFCS
jgi:hypothetical protein